MRLLLDTHVVLWWLADDPQLGARHRELIADPGNDVHFSAVSVAEIAIKSSLGKLTAPADVVTPLVDDGIAPVPFTPEHAAALRGLPWHHRDPFDRMLACQAQVEDLVLATVDARLGEYDIRTV
ncbi:type II toxin-antitoxin system VapC family toxin [Cellulomonas sp.]|uniref:type II toxin-antitoxin system VapC family toxin n=1 Tax=Cellulomonas sp. TaxID=40001 RepID=UPI002D48AEE0|nr:type II toxin-antitoxin system VapC family toxin [Cellulomonas sp.]HYQ77123.1 type II toxin-antitoxin system VapC family toxin [Cellulomonas sp.]